MRGAAQSRNTIIVCVMFSLVSTQAPITGLGADGTENTRPALKFDDAKPAEKLDALFQSNKGPWIGGDGAYSLSLSDHQALWLFSDTWIGAVKNNRRVDATMVHNTLGLATRRVDDWGVEFAIRRAADGKPRDIYSPRDGRGWFWPQSGALVGNRLHIISSQIDKTDGGGAFGFRTVGRSMLTVSNPHEPPNSWLVTETSMPNVIVEPRRELSFGAAMLVDGDQVYVLGTDETRKPGAMPDRHLIIARAPAAKFEDTTGWRYWTAKGWQADFRQADHIADEMASECSITYLPRWRQYVLIYTQSGLSAKIRARTAPKPWGPWSEPVTVYECPEAAWDKRIFCYGAKAHPELAGDDELVINYVANSFDLAQVVNDARLYWPRFVSVKIRPN